MIAELSILVKKCREYCVNPTSISPCGIPYLSAMLTSYEYVAVYAMTGIKIINILSVKKDSYPCWSC